MGNDILMWIIIILATALVVTCVVFSIIDIRSPTFSLKKDEWECVDSRKETHLHMIGKVIVPITANVCTKWERRRK